MDVKKLDTLPGMPVGFPFAMILVGISLAILGTVFGTIDARFFVVTSNGFTSLGFELIKWGAILQLVLWIVTGFGRKLPAATPPPQ